MDEVALDSIRLKQFHTNVSLEVLKFSTTHALHYVVFATLCRLLPARARKSMFLNPCLKY